MRWLVIASLFSAGCGRLSFDASAGPSDASDAGPDVSLDDVPLLTFSPQTFSGTAPDDVYDCLALDAASWIAATTTGLWRSPGTNMWTYDPFTIYSLFGAFPLGADAFVVGNVDGGNINPVAGRVTRTGTAGDDTGSPLALNDGWAASTSDIYIAGYGGNIRHSTGDDAWSPQATGTTVRLSSMWGSGPNDIYAAGDTGTILHSTGDGTWTPQPTSSSENLIELWGDGPNNLYVVGYNGTILHSTGDGTWTPENSGTTAVLLGFTRYHGIYYAVGRTTDIYRSTGDGTWEAFPSGIVSSGFQQFDAIVSDGADGLLLCGQHSLILHSP